MDPKESHLTLCAADSAVCIALVQSWRFSCNPFLHITRQHSFNTTHSHLIHLGTIGGTEETLVELNTSYHKISVEIPRSLGKYQ